jgi:hypothetical protein
LAEFASVLLSGVGSADNDEPSRPSSKPCLADGARAAPETSTGDGDDRIDPEVPA